MRKCFYKATLPLLLATLLLGLACALPLQAEDRFVVITPERTGTHLLNRALSLLTGKEVINVWDRTAEAATVHAYLTKAEQEGKFFHMHAFPEPHLIDVFKERGYKVIFLLRDPRDHLISVLFYIRERHWEYGQLRTDYPFGNLSFNDQIEEMITAEKYGICVPEEFLWKRLPWALLKEPAVYTTYFEKLVGEKGGGDSETQLAELQALANFLHLSLPEEKLEHIADILFGWDGLGTFRQGQIGTWKHYFDTNHKKLFKKNFGRQLIALGYEKDLDW